MTDDLRRDLRGLPPSLPVPGDFFDRVMATARRRRRARWTGSAGVALAVAIVGVVLGLSSSDGSSTQRLVPITPPATSMAPAPTPAPSPPTSAPATSTGLIPLSVSFVSPHVGWAYGPSQAPNGSQFPPSAPGALAVTHDGGQHWTMLPAPRISYGAPGGAKSVLFIDATHGYLYGDGLFETTDGGQHWRHIPEPGPVSQLAVAGNTLYVMAMTCPAATPLCGTYDLYTGRLDGTGYVRSGSVADTANAQLTSFGSRVFVFWSPAVTTGPAHLSISTSADGRTWSAYVTPCPALGADSGSIAPFSDSGLALVCGNSASVGIQGKTAYVSTDFGASWTARGTSSSLPEDGYVGPLAAVDESTWALAEQRGGLMVTHDGGKSWRRATEARLGQGTDGWGQVFFTDPHHGVAVPDSFYAGGLFLTSDSGDTWSAVTFPAGR